MNSWEAVLRKYRTKLTLNQREKNALHCNFEEPFVVHIQGERHIFVRWQGQAIFCRGPGRTWRYIDDDEPVTDQQFRSGFLDHELVDNLDYTTGTGRFGKYQIKYTKSGWLYLNNRKVHFHGTDSSSEESNNESDKEDTAKVDELLQSTTEGLTSALQKLSSRETSRPGTPGTSQARQASPFSARAPSPGVTQTHTPPVSKGKQPLRPLSKALSAAPASSSTTLQTPRTTPAPSQPPPQQTAAALRSTQSTSTTPASTVPAKVHIPPPAAPVPAPPPVPAAPPPPPGGNPPPNPPAMANVQPPRPIGSPLEPYDDSASKAQAFWNSLATYYNMNTNAYANDDKKIASALGYFKIGTQAGEWASHLMEEALAAHPITYGTWNAFKDTFKAQFIPPQVKAEAIRNMHNYQMGNQDFNVWYQTWSDHMRLANTDEESKMFAFR